MDYSVLACYALWCIGLLCTIVYWPAMHYSILYCTHDGIIYLSLSLLACSTIITHSPSHPIQFLSSHLYHLIAIIPSLSYHLIPSLSSHLYHLIPSACSQATFSIITTIFVAIMLIGGAVVFTNDAQTLVIDPIERE
jgi:hypothetical protein